MESQQLAAKLLEQASILLSRTHGPSYAEPKFDKTKRKQIRHSAGGGGKSTGLTSGLTTGLTTGLTSGLTSGAAKSNGQASATGPSEKQRALNRAKQTLKNAREAIDALKGFDITYPNLVDSLNRGITAMDGLIEQNKSTQKASKPNKSDPADRAPSRVKALGSDKL